MGKIKERKSTILVSVGPSCYNEISQTRGLKTKRNPFLSFEGCKSEIRVPAWPGSGEGLLLGYRPSTSDCILIWQRVKQLSGATFIRTLIPFIRALPP